MTQEKPSASNLIDRTDVELIKGYPRRAKVTVYMCGFKIEQTLTAPTKNKLFDEIAAYVNSVYDAVDRTAHLLPL